MAEMTLMCAVYGEASIFHFTFARDADVAELRETIFAKKRYELTHTFDESVWTLYLARKPDDGNGEWLKVGKRVEDFLRGEIDPQHPELLPGLLLSDAEYFGEEFKPQRGEIHVLVQLPDRASVPAKTEKLIEEIHEVVKPTNKCKRYVHSVVGSTKGKELLEDLNIKLVPVYTVSLTTSGKKKTMKIPVAPFQWEVVTNSAGEDIKRNRYRKYVEDGIGDVLAQKERCVVGIERGENILSVRVPGRDIEFLGHADILVLSDIVDEKNPHYVEELPAGSC